MDAKVDYLSFTLPLNLGGVGHGENVEREIASKMLFYGLDTLVDILAMSKAPTRNNGRKWYGCGVHWKDNNVSIWWGGVANHTLIELSGVSCQMLRDGEAMMPTIKAMNERTTRVDLAVDFPDGVTPADFVASKKQNRFKVTQTNDEDTGLTQYVGSRKSDRYSRVYRFNEPHPRAGVLRVEHVLRGRYSKILSTGLISTSIAEQVAILGNTFGWTHESWKPETVTDGKLRAKRHDKDDASTLRWLIKAVAPSLAKSHNSGLIDLHDFIDRHVMPLVDE